MKLSPKTSDARHTTEQMRRILVTQQDFDKFLAALEADTPPTEAALRAAERFRKGYVSADGTQTWTSDD